MCGSKGGRGGLIAAVEAKHGCALGEQCFSNSPAYAFGRAGDNGFLIDEVVQMIFSLLFFQLSASMMVIMIAEEQLVIFLLRQMPVQNAGEIIN